MKQLRSIGLSIIVCLLTITAAIAVAADQDADIVKHTSCSYCGMDRAKFAHSRMFVEYSDGTTAGVCSIRCIAVELAINIDKTPTSIKVGDFNTKKLINAETAFWVIGGDKPGVMSNRAKWAFEKKSDADSFVAASKGVVGSFDDAIKAAYEDMYKDTKTIRERRKMMRMKQAGGK
jgi:copper chaperone NosL